MGVYDISGTEGLKAALNKTPYCRPIAPKARAMPPLTHRGVGRPRLGTYTARAGMVAGPAVMAANHKRQLSPMQTGPGGPQQAGAPGVPKRPRMMSQYRVPESGDPMRLGNPVQVREHVQGD